MKETISIEVDVVFTQEVGDSGILSASDFVEFMKSEYPEIGIGWHIGKNGQAVTMVIERDRHA